MESIDPTYYDVLEDATFGYADVTVIQLLQHLEITYATLSADDLELNRMSLAVAWTPEEPMAKLWTKVKHHREVAIAGNEPLTEGTVLRLTLTALELMGVYTHAIQMWRDKPTNDQTWINFQAHFTHGDKERLRLLTANTAGYHGAHAATTPSLLTNPTTTRHTPNFQSENVNLYYCWSHGLGLNAAHTSATCSHPTDGHQKTATLMKHMGGNSRIMFGDRTPKHGQHKPKVTTDE